MHNRYDTLPSYHLKVADRLVREPAVDTLKNMTINGNYNEKVELYPYYIKGSTTVNGVTFTVNDEDHSIVINGTATDRAEVVLCTKQNNIILKKYTKYRIDGIPDGSNWNTFYTYITNTGIKDAIINYQDNGIFTMLDKDVSFNLILCVANGYTADNLVIKPFLRWGGLEMKPLIRFLSPIPRYLGMKIMVLQK